MPRPSARPPKVIPVPDPPNPEARANALKAKAATANTAPAPTIRAVTHPATGLSAKKAAAIAVPTAASVESHPPAKPPTSASILPSTASKGAARQSRHAKTPIAEGVAVARPIADPPKPSGRKRVLPPPVSTQPDRLATSKPAAVIARPLPPKKTTGPIVSAAKKPVSTATSLKRKPGALRIVDLGRPHNTNTQDGALLFALHILSGADAIWEPLKLTGPTDAELERAVEDYFPALLGYNSERQKGFTIGRNPQPYFVWGTESAAGRRLEGPTLIKKIRTVLCLPDRTNKP